MRGRTRPKRRRDGRQTKTDDGRLDDDDLPPSPSFLPPLSADSSHSRLHSRERKDEEKERGPFGIATTATALSLFRARPPAPASTFQKVRSRPEKECLRRNSIMELRPAARIRRKGKIHIWLVCSWETAVTFYYVKLSLPVTQTINTY